MVLSFEELFSFFNSFGYFGILLISFIGSIIIFVPIPYFPVLVAAAFDEHLNPHMISLSSAVGSVAGKMIVFYASYYGHKMLNTRTKKRIFPLHKLLSKYGWLGAFVAAALPVPDDVVYITLGIAKYSPFRFATAVFTGKMILKEITVWGALFIGRPFVEYFVSNYSNPVYFFVLIGSTAAILAIVLYFSLKLDWGKIIGKYFPWTLTDESSSDSKGGRGDKPRG
ncbi:MAG TPA: VTT domain-containing protein [Nitrososphaeraceae archaeon]|nr:VTT domain-containing protein [Nitrososphaeraceae archaeon]